MTFIEKVAAKIESEEGRRHSVYLCTAGKRTVGVGFNLDDYPVPALVQEFWVDDAKNRIALMSDPSCLTVDQTLLSDRVIDFWLKYIVNQLTNKLVQHEWFNKLDENRRVVLIDMAFQMGTSGMLGFTDMINALRAERWYEAANECLDSKYAREDTPNRANRNAEILRTGEL